MILKSIPAHCVGKTIAYTTVIKLIVKYGIIVEYNIIIFYRFSIQ